jgi:hypothetical protein
MTFRQKYLRMSVAALLMGSVAVVSSDASPASASGVTHTITISGPCDGSGAASDWQTVTSKDPLDPTAVAEFGVGDSLTIVNSCNQAGLGLEDLHLIHDPFNGFPLLSQNPTFSDGVTTWVPMPDPNPNNDRGYGRISRGESVTIVFSTADPTTIFRLSDMLAGDSPNTNSRFADCVTDPNNCVDLNHGHFKVIARPGIAPATQTVSGQAGTAITPTTAFTANNFSGAVTYSVTGANQLPAGLTLDANTGEISGTPTATSTVTVTITATGATSGTATATVTFAITAAPAPAPVFTTPPTTVPPTTTLPPGVPALVNSENQQTLTQAPGGATAIVNGQPVAVEVQAPADLPAANVAPEDRTPAQVQQLQQAANEIVDRLADVAGGSPAVNVEPTPTGAVITGLLTENVPVEDVVLVETPETATLFAALNGDGTVTEVNPGGVIQVLGDGTVGVLAYGLTPGENVELVIMSDPQLLGSFEVNDQGEVKVQAGLPDGLGAGDHTLVVASPTIQASLGLQVAERPITLPVTGGDTDTLAPVLVMLSLGAVLVVIARRRITLVP